MKKITCDSLGACYGAGGGTGDGGCCSGKMGYFQVKDRHKP